MSSLKKSATGEWIIVAAADIVRTQLRGNKYTCEKRSWYDDDNDDDDASNDNDIEIIGRYSVWVQERLFLGK